MQLLQFAMRSLDRYFSEEPIAGNRAVLSGAESHHLAHVMRGKIGTQLIVFDGQGGEYLAQIARIERDRVEVSILERRDIERELPFKLTLAVSLPKGDRQKWLVEKLVELGVTRLVPLVAARSVVQPAERTFSRLSRGVIEASKQCGRNRLMEIAAPVSWADWVRGERDASARFVAHPADHGDRRGAGASRFQASRCFRGDSIVSQADCVVAAVGPEGGFTPEEIALAAAAKWTIVDLGPRILRVETAAVVLAARIACAFSGKEAAI